MKKSILFGLTTIAIAAVVIVACKKNANPGFEQRGAFAGPYVDTVDLPLVIAANRTLSVDTLYLLDGKTYVTNNAELTIEEGTRIEGVKKSTADSSSALIITRGSTIIAEGGPTTPIVFTSNQASKAPGDWGGIVILGKAPLNRADTTIEGIGTPSLPLGVDINYGAGTPCATATANVDDNSGILRYVRIEYAGAVITEGNELNGLTLGGVGRGTTLDFIQVSYGADDAFEFFGGNVCAKHLVSYGNNDDDFDFDFGFNGTIQFAVSTRVPDAIKPLSPNPNGIESDNNPGSVATGCKTTEVLLSNLTIIGTDDSTEAVGAAPAGKAMLNGALFRQFSSLRLYNSIVMDYPTGVRLQSTTTVLKADSINYNLIHAYQTVANGFTLNGTNTSYRTGTPGNGSVKLVAPYASTPDFRPSASLSSPAVSGANFTKILPNTGNCAITVTTYRGAFAPDNVAGSNWMSGWTNFSL